MQCREVEPLLPEYADDALPPARQERVAAHLAGCPACRRELDTLHSALTALNRASQPPAQDLWAEFQVRLSREGAPAAVSTNGASGAGDCARILALLPGYLDGETSPAERDALSRHLSACAGCASEHAALSRSLAALASAPRPSPDLWPALAARLAAEQPAPKPAAAIACREVGDLLAAYLGEGLEAARAARVQGHLDGCPACARELVTLRTALHSLERAGAAVSAPDLWPAFAARLEQERSRRPALAGWTAFPAIWLRGALERFPQPSRRVLQPALALAGVLALLIGSRSWAPAPGPGVRTTGSGAVAQVQELPPPGERDPASDSRAAVQTVRVVKASPVRPKRSGVRAVRVASAPAVERRLRPRRPRRKAPVVLAARTRPSTPPSVTVASSSLASQLEISYNLPASAPVTPDLPASAPVALNPETGQQEVMPELVKVVTLLVKVDDAATQPFGTNSDAP